MYSFSLYYNCLDILVTVACTVTTPMRTLSSGKMGGLCKPGWYHCIVSLRPIFASNTKISDIGLEVYNTFNVFNSLNTTNTCTFKN